MPGRGHLLPRGPWPSQDSRAGRPWSFSAPAAAPGCCCRSRGWFRSSPNLVPRCGHAGHDRSCTITTVGTGPGVMVGKPATVIPKRGEQMSCAWHVVTGSRRERKFPVQRMLEKRRVLGVDRGREGTCGSMFLIEASAVFSVPKTAESPSFKECASSSRACAPAPWGRLRQGSQRFITLMSKEPPQ